MYQANLRELSSVDTAKEAIRNTIKRIMKPSPRLTMLQFAEEHIVLSSDDSANPGKYNSAHAVYQREILEAISDPSTSEVVLSLSSQVGKTLIDLITIGYYSAIDPASIMYVTIDDALGLDFAKRRVAPLIRNSKLLTDTYKKLGVGGNTVTSKFFPGGSLTIASANIPSDLTSRPIRIVICDEVDKFTQNAKGMGSPLALVRQRQVTFHNRKLILTSTPTRADTSIITKSFEAGTQARFYHQCPHCSDYFTPVWENVKWVVAEDDEPLFDTAALMCPHCACLIDDTIRQKSINNGKWIHAYPDRRVKSFFLNALTSPFTSLSTLVEQYYESLSDINKRIQFVNEILGLPWEDEGIRVDHIQFGDRLEKYTKDTLPNNILFATAGVDVQANRLEAVIYGWYNDYESYVIDRIIISGLPSEPTTWKTLHHALQYTYKRQDNTPVKLLKTCIDTGGFTEESGAFQQYVVDFVKKNARFNYVAVKGASTRQKTIIPQLKKSPGSIYLIDTIAAKDMIYDNLAKTTKGAGYMHFHHELDADFFNQLTSEEKVKEVKNGITKWYYKRITAKRAAEVLDCTVYALAARLSLHPAIEKTMARKEVNIENQLNTDTKDKDYLLSLPTASFETVPYVRHYEEENAGEKVEAIADKPANKYAKLFSK